MLMYVLYWPVYSTRNCASIWTQGRSKKLVTAHHLKVYIELRKASNNMYMTAGWAQFIEATGLQVQEPAVFRVLSTSKMHFIIFAKDGYLRCPVPDKPRDSEPTRQSFRTSSPQGKWTVSYSSSPGKTKKKKNILLYTAISASISLSTLLPTLVNFFFFKTLFHLQGKPLQLLRLSNAASKGS